MLAVEEPLEIQLGYGEETSREVKSIAVTMRTPGHDAELALGFLYTEGVIRDGADVDCVRDGQGHTGNVVCVELSAKVEVESGQFATKFLYDVQLRDLRQGVSACFAFGVSTAKSECPAGER